MEDPWRVKSSAVAINDLADLAEYHRFLERFRHEAADDNMNRLLYGEARFGSTDQVPEEG
jgi:hypothetical protein